MVTDVPFNGSPPAVTATIPPAVTSAAVKASSGRRASGPRSRPARKTAKVINLMDALRKSVRGDEAPAATKKAVARSTGTGSKKGLTLVKSAGGKTGRSRKSA